MLPRMLLLHHLGTVTDLMALDYHHSSPCRANKITSPGPAATDTAELMMLLHLTLFRNKHPPLPLSVRAAA